MKKIIMSELKELANKEFATEDECIKAEKEILAKRKEKEEATKARKEEALVVEEAYKARNAAIKEYQEKEIELRKAFNKKVLEEKEAFDKDIEKLQNDLDKADETYEKALNDFIEKHPEGYHMTLKDGDNTTIISRSGDVSKLFDDVINFTDTVFSNFFKNF